MLTITRTKIFDQLSMSAEAQIPGDRTSDVRVNITAKLNDDLKDDTVANASGYAIIPIASLDGDGFATKDQNIVALEFLAGSRNVEYILDAIAEDCRIYLP